MKREDFIKILDSHFDVCRKIIDDNGKCKYINCTTCPFPSTNNVKGIRCVKLYSCSYTPSFEGDPKLLESCKEFLKFETQPKAEAIEFDDKTYVNGGNMKYLKGSEAVKALEEGKVLIGTKQLEGVQVYISRQNNKNVTYDNIFSTGRMPLRLHEFFYEDEWIVLEELKGIDILLYLLNNPLSVLKECNSDNLLSLKNNQLIGIIKPIDPISVRYKYYFMNKEDQDKLLNTTYQILNLKLTDFNLEML
jgi:hypothetical protein